MCSNIAHFASITMLVVASLVVTAFAAAMIWNIWRELIRQGEEE